MEKGPAAAATAAVEKKKQPPIPLDKRTDFVRICLAGGIMTALSGIVNGIALVELGLTPGFPSGTTMNMGRMLGIDAKKFIYLWLTFLGGGIFAGASQVDGDAFVEGRFSPGLLLSAVLLAAGVVAKKQFDSASAALSLMSFAQGLQNAITTSFSSVVIRSTHAAGGMTDSALVIGQCLRKMSKGEDLPALRKTILTLITVLSFAGGGFLSRFAQRRFGLNGIFLPAAVVALMATASPLGPGEDKARRAA